MANDSIYQEKYWKELTLLKTHILYLEEYLLQTENIEYKINWFLAISSNSSICGWAIWSKHSFIWALIIAGSQLINATKSFLPYKKRMKAIRSLLHDLDELMIFIESKWFQVSEGSLTNEEIHLLQMNIKKKKSRSIREHLISPLPEKKKYLNKALSQANTYFSNFYNQEE